MSSVWDGIERDRRNLASSFGRPLPPPRWNKVRRFQDAEGKFEGYVCTYDTLDDYGTIFQRGCFNESLAERMPRVCWSHDWGEPIGRVIEVEDREEGLWVRAQLDDPDDVPQARRAWSQLQSGTIVDLAVGFRLDAVRSPTDDEKMVHHKLDMVIVKAELDEVSLVLRGAVPGAMVMATRRRTERVPAGAGVRFRLHETITGVDADASPFEHYRCKVLAECVLASAELGLPREEWPVFTRRRVPPPRPEPERDPPPQPVRRYALCRRRDGVVAWCVSDG